MKEKIISILTDTQNSLELIPECIDNPCLFTSDFVKKVHFTIMQTDCFNEYLQPDENDILVPVQVISLIVPGEYRKTECIVYHDKNTDDGFDHIVQFCTFSEIEKEMERYCEIAKDVLQNDDLDIFLKVSWLQWAFLRIHPFADGNGRVARIISSIPLYQKNLPPVVPLRYKQHYYSALRICYFGSIFIIILFYSHFIHYKFIKNTRDDIVLIK